MASQLQSEILKAAIAEAGGFAMDVRVLASTDSTNSWSMQQCESGKTLPFACFAEEQTRGRGRRGKQWFMPPYSNIAMSLAWPFDLSQHELYLLPVSIAVAITQSLESFGLKQVQIKWPNDIYVFEKKIAGILIETRPARINHWSGGRTENELMAVVIGIGVNYDMSMLDHSSIQEKLVYTDICEQTQSQQLERLPERPELAAALLCHVVDICQNFQQQSEHCLKVFRSRYDYCRHKNIQIMLDSQEVLTGVAQGVNDRAELMVTIDGEDRIFNSGEVSIRASSDDQVT